MKLKGNLNFDQIKKEIAIALDYNSFKNIRIFKQGGVELDEDDMEFLH